MITDKMYCMNCGKIFLDDWTTFDTRTDNLISNCPHCDCMHTINASAVLDSNKLKRRFDNIFIIMLRMKVSKASNMKVNRREDIFYRRCELKCVNH